MGSETITLSSSNRNPRSNRDLIYIKKRSSLIFSFKIRTRSKITGQALIQDKTQINLLTSKLMANKSIAINPIQKVINNRRMYFSIITLSCKVAIFQVARIRRPSLRGQLPLSKTNSNHAENNLARKEEALLQLNPKLLMKLLSRGNEIHILTF